MALHDKDSIRGELDDDVYASTDFAVSMPKYKFPQLQRDPRHAYAEVHDELMLDGNARQNLATFCQTWEEPEVHRLMDECIDKNIVDKDEYPQIAEIESRCVHMLSDLWNSPAGDNAVGKPFDKPSLITGPVQVCWHRITRYWDVEHREIPMDKDRLLMTLEEVLKLCDENTIGVVPTLGVTFTGGFEPVAAVSQALDQLQRDIALNFSLPGGQVACQYYNFLRLGTEGYRKIHGACYDTAEYLAGEIGKLGPFEIIFNGERDQGIPALCWKMKDGEDPGFNLYDLADRLRVRGWQVPAYSLPANSEDLAIQRILVRHGVSRDLATLSPTENPAMVIA